MKGFVLAALCLGGCSSMGGPTDWLLPDALTVGQGSSTLGGDCSDGGHDFGLDGEEESTYAALTWKLPGIERSDGMSRETQRNMALLIDKMVEDEIGVVDDATGGPALKDGVPSPPWWLPYAFGGAILLFLAFMGLKSRSNGWH